MKHYILATAAALLASTSAIAAELPADIAEAGHVVVANMPNYPPMEYRDPKTNELKGVDIELGLALAQAIGTEIEWSEIGFQEMIPALTTGRVDMILSGMSDLPKRRDSLDFVDYMKSGAQFYTLSKNAETYATPEDLCGATVGMSRRTSFPDETKKWSAAHCEANGKPAINVVGTEGSADARTQLIQGRLDAAVQGSETLPYLMSLQEDTFSLVGEPFTAVYQGMGFAKDDTALRDAFAAGMKTIMENGEYAKVFAANGLEGAMLDGIYINGEPAE